MTREKMIAAVLIVLILFGWVSYSETHYDREATITQVNKYSVVATDDLNDYEWEFEGTNYQLGEKVVLKMNTCFTDEIFDDIVEDAVRD